MQGRRICDSSIRKREVDGYGQIYFAATENILQEGISLLDLGAFQVEHPIVALYDRQLVGLTVFSQLLHIQVHTTDILVAAIFLRYEELDLDILSFILTAHI